MREMGQIGGGRGALVHDLIDLLDRQGAVDLLHGFAGVVHG